MPGLSKRTTYHAKQNDAKISRGFPLCGSSDCTGNYRGQFQRLSMIANEPSLQVKDNRGNSLYGRKEGV